MNTRTKDKARQNLVFLFIKNPQATSFPPRDMLREMSADLIDLCDQQGPRLGGHSQKGASFSKFLGGVDRLTCHML